MQQVKEWNAHNMKMREKAEMLKNTITHLYCQEGRTISYMSRLLEIDRTTIRHAIKDWELKPAKPTLHLTPSNEKFLNANRDQIVSLFNQDMRLLQVANALGVNYQYLDRSIIPADKVLTDAYNAYKQRMKDKAKQREEQQKKESCHEYNIIDEEGEEWRPILGYPNYMVSSHGRVKKFVASYNDYHIVKPAPNVRTNRLYVGLMDNKKKSHNLLLHRIVAHTFVDGWDENHDTVNHKDGDTHNNHADNLEWTSQAENNLHAYRTLGRSVVSSKRHQFSKIVYKGQYEFKTVAAFAKFIGKSETQTRRYLDEPEAHDIELVA